MYKVVAKTPPRFKIVGPVGGRLIPKTPGGRNELVFFGSGGNADVYEVPKKSDDSPEKLVKLPLVPGGNSKEIKALSGLKHPNIVTINPALTSAEEDVLVVNKVNGSTLAKLTFDDDNGVHFTEDQLVSILQQLVEAVRYLHENNVIHGDLTPDNIMIEGLDNGQLLVKVIDFGLARSGPDSASAGIAASDACLTHSPPEYFTKKTVSKASDIWALGITMIEILRREVQFEISMFEADHDVFMKTSIETLISEIQNQGEDDSEDDDLIDELDGALPGIVNILQKMLVLDPKKRITANDLIKEINGLVSFSTDDPGFYADTSPGAGDVRKAEFGLFGESKRQKVTNDDKP